MTTTPRIVLEVPPRGVSLGTAYASNLAMLALIAEKTFPDPMGMIAEALFLTKPESCDIYLQAINEYESLDKISWRDNCGVSSERALNVVRVASREGINHVIASWKAERYLVIMTQRNNLVERLKSILPEPKWWQWRTKTNEEERYFAIAEIDKKVGLIYQDHRTLELLGTRAEIMRCFDLLRASMLPSEKLRPNEQHGSHGRQ
jgi:hypothetical protein